MIKQHNGEPQITGYKKAASTVFAFNDVVTRDSSGYLVRATATTPRSELLGLIQRDVLSTDTDYASNTLVPVAEFDDKCEFLADVSTGTAVQAMVGKRYDLDDHNSIDVNSTLQRCVEVVRVVSTSQVIVKFVKDGDRARLVTYTQTVGIANFTDGGGATGTLALGVSIPAGAVFVRTMIKGLTGTTGETSSATMTVGDGSDVDRYNTGTPSVAADAAAGVDMGAPSGTAFHSAAKTPTLTVTDGADFTALGALAFDITLMWYQMD